MRSIKKNVIQGTVKGTEKDPQKHLDMKNLNPRTVMADI